MYWALYTSLCPSRVVKRVLLRGRRDTMNLRRRARRTNTSTWYTPPTLTVLHVATLQTPAQHMLCTVTLLITVPTIVTLRRHEIIHVHVYMYEALDGFAARFYVIFSVKAFLTNQQLMFTPRVSLMCLYAQFVHGKLSFGVSTMVVSGSVM